MNYRAHHGASILDIIVSLAIFALLISAIGAFQIAVFRQHASNEARADIDQKTILLMRQFTRELRAAQQSNSGEYPISEATGTSLSFFTDINGDGIVEKLRYSRSGSTIVRGIITPSGNPLSYDPGNEIVRTFLNNVEASDIFTYYDETYNGVDELTPLTLPVTLSDIRLIDLSITVDPQKPGVLPVDISSSITIRNLRDV